MGILIKKAFAQLLFWLYEFLDAIFEMFRVLCGIESVEYTENGETVSRSIIEIFLESSAVTKAFLMLFLLAIIVCAISVIVAVVKNIINMKGGEPKSHAKTVGQGFGSIIVTAVMAVIMILGISGSNAILGEVYNKTVTNENVSISAMLFNMSISESYVYDLNDPQTRQIQGTDENGNLLWETIDGKTTTDKNAPNVKKENNESKAYMVQETYYDFKRDPDTKEYILETGWRDGYSIEDIVFSKSATKPNQKKVTVDQVFGVHRKNILGIEEADKGYTKSPMVELDSFNIFTAYFVVILVIVALVWSMLGLVKRIFDLVTLFIMLPLISATIPLDDGARLKTWRETVVSKVVLAYGAVISVNVFMLLIPLINNLSFTSLGWGKFVEVIFKMFMLIGGALCINGGQLLIARVFGTSAEESREMAQSARALLGGAVAMGGMMHSAKNVLFGGKNKYGRETKGILRGISNGAGKATNVAGNLLGGQAYRSVASKAMGAVGGVKDSLRGLTTSSRPSPAPASSIGKASSSASRTQTNGAQQMARAKQINSGAVGALNGASKNGNNASKSESILKNGFGGAVMSGIKMAKESAKFQHGSKVLKPIKPSGSSAYKPPIKK